MGEQNMGYLKGAKCKAAKEKILPIAPQMEGFKGKQID
jgi:hypothetical protein